MRPFVVLTVVAEALVALALVLAVSYMTSTETCVTPVPDESLYNPNSGATTTCSSHFWWQ